MKLVSFDIKSLFTSVPTDELKIILTKHINKSHLNPDQQDILLKSINTCLNQNYFKFNNKYYKQNSGLPMGSPLSPLLAEIYMADFEDKFINTNNNNNRLLKHISFWGRYVDDILCIWSGTSRQLDQFLLYLNSLNSKIQFTIEKEVERTLNFLDIKIIRTEDKLEFDIFRKITTTDTIIPANSNQSWNIKMSVFHSLIHRLLNFPLNADNYKKEENIIKTIARNNGYNTQLIDKMIKKKQRNILIKIFFCEQTEQKNDKRYHSINYIPTVSSKVSNNLNKLGFNIIQTNKVNIGQLLVNNKEKTKLCDKSGVYEVGCSDCDAIYIGQSGRSIQERINEHKKAILNNNRNTGFAEHCIDNTHIFNTSNYHLLHNNCKGRKLDMLEILEIKKATAANKNVTNTQLTFVNTPIIDTVVQSLPYI